MAGGLVAAAIAAGAVAVVAGGVVGSSAGRGGGPLLVAGGRWLDHAAGGEVGVGAAIGRGQELVHVQPADGGVVAWPCRGVGVGAFDPSVLHAVLVVDVSWEAGVLLVADVPGARSPRHFSAAAYESKHVNLVG